MFWTFIVSYSSSSSSYLILRYRYIFFLKTYCLIFLTSFFSFFFSWISFLMRFQFNMSSNYISLLFLLLSPPLLRSPSSRSRFLQVLLKFSQTVSVQCLQQIMPSHPLDWYPVLITLSILKLLLVGQHKHLIGADHQQVKKYNRLKMLLIIF